MSVLVEAVTLVVRRPSLEAVYRGGVDAFLQAARGLPTPPRFACDRDPQLVNVSFERRDHAAIAIELLETNGLVNVEDTKAGDFVYVDQQNGPAAPCDWLEWERFTDGVTVAWMAGLEPGTLAAPEDWTPADASPAQSDGDSDLTRTSNRFLPLATKDKTEILLDLDTGTQIERVIERAAEAPSHAADAALLHSAILAALADRGWTTYLDEPPAVMVDLRGADASYTCRYLALEDMRAVVCYTRAPLLVPKASRRKVMEFITRVNYAISFGAFEMSLDDGGLYFRATCAVEDGVLTTEMVTTLASVGIWAFDTYYAVLLEVVYAKRSVAEAMRALDSRDAAA